jgi:hypothetical protein
MTIERIRFHHLVCSSDARWFQHGASKRSKEVVKYLELPPIPGPDSLGLQAYVNPMLAAEGEVRKKSDDDYWIRRWLQPRP